jgi:DNA-binding GntR family transcriptional regulator
VAISRTQALPEDVATYVRELILSGKVRPGEFLRLEPIAEAVGVSNTPVREGLLSLRAEGFVQLVPRRGFMVEPFTRQDVHDIFWAQAKLAGELAARAAKRITPAELTKLEAILAELEAAYEADDEDRIVDQGVAFHRQINRAADSRRLGMILNSIVQHVPNRFYATIEGHVDAIRADHPALFAAIKARNSREARRIAEAHLLESTDHLIEMLERRGLWADDDAEQA